MVTQKLSLSAQHNNTPQQYASKLIGEIGMYHIALMVKSEIGIEAFEVYEIDATTTTWQNIFAAIKNYSKIFTKNYTQSAFYLNTTEALLVPEAKFSKESIEPYLTSIFGKANLVQYEADIVQIPTNPVTIYRLPLALNETIKNNFMLFSYKHTYTKILEKLLGNGTMVMEMIKVQFYSKYMIVVVVYGNKLQLIQSYNYKSPEDVIYYLLNIVQEFSLNVKSTAVEVSGMIDIQSKYFEVLENVFGRLSLETITAQGIFKDYLSVANAHYYTPFYNLSL